jgi:hypothetical protein
MNYLSPSSNFQQAKDVEMKDEEESVLSGVPQKVYSRLFTVNLGAQKKTPESLFL